MKLDDITTKQYIEIIKKYFKEHNVEWLIEPFEDDNYTRYIISKDFVTLAHKCKYYGRDSHDYFFNINFEGLSFGHINEEREGNLPESVYESPGKNAHWKKFIENFIQENEVSFQTKEEKSELDEITTKEYIDIIKKYFKEHNVEWLIEPFEDDNYTRYIISKDFVTLAHKCKYYGRDSHDYYFNVNFEGLSFGHINEEREGNLPESVYESPGKNAHWKKFIKENRIKEDELTF